jgi:serine/threonine protein kinase/HEAT repeat protein
MREVHNADESAGRAVAGDPLHPAAPPQEPATAVHPNNLPLSDAGRPTIPGFEIIEELGRGGMGVVYKARQVSLNRFVALKVILAGPFAGPEQLARFRVEAEALARLQHAGIVQIHEIGSHAGHSYLALEYVSGDTLNRNCAGRPLPATKAAQLVETLSRAVQYAHQRGIIHRDLKPGNVLLAEDGQPKITDFGLAKLLDIQPGTATPGPQTQSGTILGTPAYMAPEQAGGKRGTVGPATDVYALGAILYELLTGRPPFQAETPLDVILKVATEEPTPPRSLQPGRPAELEAVCLKCMHKDPKTRYASAMELGEDLHRFLAGEATEARPVSSGERPRRWVWRRRWRLVGAGAAAGTAILAGVLIFAVFHRRPPAKAAPMSILEVLALSEDLKSDDPETRAKAAVALGKAGKDARVAMPALLDALRDTDEKVRDLVADALDQAGPPAADDFPALSTALRDDDPDVRTYAVSALGDVGEPSWEEIDRVRELTKDPDPYVRAAAEKTLTRMEKDMLESLRNRLKDSNPSTRKEAAERLSDLGGGSDDAADKAAASLMAAMTDDNEAVRMAVSKALSDFGAQVVPMLSEALRNRNVVARRMAISSLAAMGDNAIDAAPVLAGMVDDPDVGAAAADALNNLGDLTVPAIAAALGSPTIDENRRIILQNLLVRIGPAALPAINYYVNRYPGARAYFNPVFNQLKVSTNTYVRAPLTDPYAQGYYRDYVGRLRALEHADRQFLNLEKAQQKLNMNEAAFKAFLRRVDRNGDGEISRAEYERWAHDQANVLAREDHARNAVQNAEKKLHNQLAKSTTDAQKQAALVRHTPSGAAKKNTEQRAAAAAAVRAMQKKAQPLQAQAHRDLLNKQHALSQVQRHAPAAKHAPAPTKRMAPARPPVHRAAPPKPPTRNPVVHHPAPVHHAAPPPSRGGGRRQGSLPEQP